MLAFAIITLLFALIFKVIPDVKISWKDVWLGAVVTALLFTIGKWALSFYLGQSTPSSAYGVAGSLIVLLLWVYYSKPSKLSKSQHSLKLSCADWTTRPERR